MSRYTRFKAGHPAGFIEAFANYYEDIAEALNDYKVTRNINLNKECFGVVESVEGLNFLESITKSSITKQWVKLNNR